MIYNQIIYVAKRLLEMIKKLFKFFEFLINADRENFNLRKEMQNQI